MVRLVASLTMGVMLLSQLPVGSLFSSPALGQALAIYTDPGSDDSGNFLGIDGLAADDISKVGMVGLVIYGAVTAITTNAGDVAATVAGTATANSVTLSAPIIAGDEDKPIWDTLYDDKSNRFTQFTKSAEINEVKEDPLREKPNSPYTAFAPTDAAMQSLSSTKLMDTSYKLENKKFLLKHVVIGKYSIEDLEKLDSGFPLATVSGDTLILTKDKNGVLKINNVIIVREDINASNGISHPIDTAL